ncbi:MAG: DUF998 domain-containing protein [Ruminococcaceae bacterium]|nr:DUF998 domain-containing protein [Oscillospiraceae bacterium]
MQIVVIFFSLLFCVFAFASTAGGMLVGSVQSMITADFWVDVLTDDTLPIGGVLNMIEGKDTYENDATLADVTFEKLDDKTIEQYNLTQENLNELYATSKLSTFVSGKMESAMNAALKGEVFEMNSSEVIGVIRESEDDFTKITGVEMNEEHYATLEQAIRDAGVKDIKHDFSEKGAGDLSLLETILEFPFDMILYGATAFFFLVIFLMNRRSKRRTLLYAGGVLAVSGWLFVQVDRLVSMILGMVGEMDASVKSVINVVARALSSVGFTVMIVGIVLLAIYLGMVIFGIVMKIKRKKNRNASVEVSENNAEEQTEEQIEEQIEEAVEEATEE